MLLNFEDDPVRKPTDSGWSAFSMNDGELQTMIDDRVNRVRNCGREAVSQLWPDGIVPVP
jgi:hypothetical protein